MDIGVELLETLERLFERAKRICLKKGLNEQDAEDCAAEVRLNLLLHLQRGGVITYAYFLCVLKGCLADFWNQQFPTVPLEVADLCGGGGAILRPGTRGALSTGAAGTC
jgi:DNA-directed RNA polymerase specialized sigma24 family protein